MQKTISKETNKKNMWTQNPDKTFTPGRVGQMGVIDDRGKRIQRSTRFRTDLLQGPSPAMLSSERPRADAALQVY